MTRKKNDRRGTHDSRLREASLLLGWGRREGSTSSTPRRSTIDASPGVDKSQVCGIFPSWLGSEQWIRGAKHHRYSPKRCRATNAVRQVTSCLPIMGLAGRCDTRAGLGLCLDSYACTRVSGNIVFKRWANNQLAGYRFLYAGQQDHQR